MKNFKHAVIFCSMLFTSMHALAQDTNKFKLFEKSTQFSGFGGMTLNLLNGEYFLIGGQGAGIFGNYYFGGFGFGGDIGTYTYPLSLNEYKVKRSSGGLCVGGISNSAHIFALYAEMKLSFDQYEARPAVDGLNLATIGYRSISLIPSAGIAFRPIHFLQIRLGAGYNNSGIIDDGGFENVPYRAPMFNFDLTFGQF